ncbi:hypothetical protein L198_02301 [Cryptococcus wingfieldii CBS 7118]|uniref:Uncharacterized protein n=1 Tax=Cryptococcus wingfieldii CBS 7118 TaxID=1295528 RepID=A0A1E3JRG5_9TREE|nr:hypothetical protein L198_02301 [Cryptococcus wingfieldii CBS 7118]ODO03454.1 hypothetical protein L198_02301 [Cryptococcus wingfieldii CBS 7118]
MITLLTVVALMVTMTVSLLGTALLSGFDLADTSFLLDTSTTHSSNCVSILPCLAMVIFLAFILSYHFNRCDRAPAMRLVSHLSQVMETLCHTWASRALLTPWYQSVLRALQPSYPPRLLLPFYKPYHHLPEDTWRNPPEARRCSQGFMGARKDAEKSGRLRRRDPPPAASVVLWNIAPSQTSSSR